MDDQPTDEPVGPVQADGPTPTGETGQLQQPAIRLLQSALKSETTAPRPCQNAPTDTHGGSSRNGKRSKTAPTDLGPAELPTP